MLWDGEIDPSKLPDGDAGTDAGDGDAGGGVAPLPPQTVRNCFKHNGDATFVNFDWAAQGAHKSMDVTAYECTRPALPKIEL